MFRAGVWDFNPEQQPKTTPTVLWFGMLSAAQITSSFGGTEGEGGRRPREMRERLRDPPDAIARSHCIPLSSDRNNNEGGRRRGREVAAAAGSTLLRLWADGDVPHFWEGEEACATEEEEGRRGRGGEVSHTCDATGRRASV